jgi:hypothetical protein
MRGPEPDVIVTSKPEWKTATTKPQDKLMENVPFALKWRVAVSRVKDRAATSDLMVAVLVFVVSFLIRLIWVLWVQRPGDALFSDMGAYIQRAQALVSGTQGQHYSISLIPYGTHYLYALEMLLFGRENYTALAIAQTLMGAVAPACAVPAATYCIQSRLALAVVAVLSCVWYPIISYCGFFSSEVPYSFLLYLALLCSFRYVKTGRGATLTGVVHGMAFTVRPQMILTILLLALWAIVRRRGLAAWKTSGVIALVVPVVLIVGYSAHRYQHFTGERGLISGNGPATRLFGATDYGVCIAYERNEKGDVINSVGFGTPSGPELGLFRKFCFEGRLTDARVINAEIRSYQSHLSLVERLRLRWRAVSLLAYGNTLWPERMYTRVSRWRYVLCGTWQEFVGLVWFPLALVGLLVVPFQRNLYLEIIGLHVVTMLYAAYAYIGEIRYRVPYDLMLTILAVLGACTIWRKIRAASGGQRLRAIAWDRQDTPRGDAAIPLQRSPWSTGYQG